MRPAGELSKAKIKKVIKYVEKTFSDDPVAVTEILQGFGFGLASREAAVEAFGELIDYDFVKFSKEYRELKDLGKEKGLIGPDTTRESRTKAREKLSMAEKEKLRKKLGF